MNGKRMLLATAVLLSLLCLSSSFIGVGYADDTGSYTDSASSEEIGVSSPLVRLCDSAGKYTDGPLFASRSVRYIQDGSTYSVEESLIVDGSCFLVIDGNASGPYSIGVAYSMSSSCSSDPAVQIQVSLSTSPGGQGLSYEDVATDGSFSRLTVRDSSGAEVEPGNGVPYYIFVKIKAVSGLTSKISGTESIRLTFGAASGGCSAGYIAGGNTLVTLSVTDIVRVASGSGYVSDEGNTDGHAAAGIWTDSGERRCVGVGSRTEYTLEIRNGTQFCIRYDCNIGGWGVFGKIELVFHVSYVENGVRYEFEKTLGRSDYTGTKAAGFIGEAGGDDSCYGSISALDRESAWIGSSDATDIRVTVSGDISSWSEMIGGHAHAGIILR